MQPAARLLSWQNSTFLDGEKTLKGLFSDFKFQKFILRDQYIPLTFLSIVNVSMIRGPVEKYTMRTKSYTIPVFQIFSTLEMGQPRLNLE